MLTTDPMAIMQPEIMADTVDDAAILRTLEEFDAAIRADKLVFNARFLWSVALDPKHQEVAGDAQIVFLSIASLTRHPAYGCRATHRQIARRAGSIKRLFELAQEVTWKRIAQVLKIGA
jgi:hypothetical protein